jgi:hypothetical protein
MVIALKVEVTGIEKLNQGLARLTPKKHKEIMSGALMDCAKLVMINAKDRQIRKGGRVATKGPRGGRVLKSIGVHPTMLTSRSGDLRESIDIDRQPLPFAIDIGTHFGYGAIHEQGLGNYPVRAFLAPAVKEEEGRFPKVFMKHWRRVGRV